MTIEEELEQANAQLEALRATNATLQSDLDTARESAASAITGRDMATAERDSALASVATITAERDFEKARADKAQADAGKLATENATFTAQLEEAKNVTNAKINEVLAASGGRPLRVARVEDDVTSMSRADFNNLTPAAQAAYCKRRGTITD